MDSCGVFGLGKEKINYSSKSVQLGCSQVPEADGNTEMTILTII